MKIMIIFILILLAMSGRKLYAWKTSIVYDPGIQMLSFAASHIKNALNAQKFAVTDIKLSQLSTVDSPVRIIMTTLNNPAVQSIISHPGLEAIPALESEGYSLRIENAPGYVAYWIIGGDIKGVMYGGLDLAEVIQHEGTILSIKRRDRNPFIKKRGIKFNIPLDARTPSYSDNNIFSQQNIENMWDMNFWQEFFDEMALNRLNLLTLWSLSPFPSLVHVPEYPNAGLDDVKKTNLPVTEFGKSSSGSKNVTPEVLENLVTIKKISLKEKIKFWQGVMQYATNRGIDIYLYIWNVFAFGTEGSGYGITDDINNQTTRDYLRKATRAMIETYPLLKGIGICAGENMSHNEEADETFLFDTYGQGINDALNANPNRQFRLIHRLGNITLAKKAFAGLHPGCMLNFCYKYSKAHVYSSVAPYWIHDHRFLEEIGDSTGFFITIRDDSYYYLRGGSDPDFTRAYIKNIPNIHANFEGFQLGPDGIVWGREYVSRAPEAPPQLILKKRWYSFRIWGKLAYDPDTPDSEFMSILAYRFPQVNAQHLFDAWAGGSKVVPLVNRFHNYKAYLDYQWNPEICDSRTGYNSDSGFHDLDTFIKIKTQQQEGFIGIKEFIGGDSSGTTPFKVSEKLLQLSQNIMKNLSLIDISQANDRELLQTISDIKAMAFLGGYYSCKISAATYKAFFYRTGEAKYKADAIKSLQQASIYWWDYSHQLDGIYKPLFYSRLRKTVNVLETQRYVDQEIIDLGGEVPAR
ncbi:carbohydrate-binding family 6 protein [candidate division KSB1 bacterium]|nr:carbohydrate-binding family 6 protein [candidate division KSB1 bacterium]